MRISSAGVAVLLVGEILGQREYAGEFELYVDENQGFFLDFEAGVVQAGSNRTSFVLQLDEEFEDLDSFARSSGRLCLSTDSDYCLQRQDGDSDLMLFDGPETQTQDTPTLRIIGYERSRALVVAIKDEETNLCVGLDGSDALWIECGSVGRMEDDDRIQFTLQSLDFEISPRRDEDPLCLRCPDRWPVGSRILFRTFQAFLFIGLFSVCACYWKRMGSTPLWVEDRITYVKATVFRRGMTEKQLDALRLENLGR